MDCYKHEKRLEEDFCLGELSRSDPLTHDSRIADELPIKSDYRYVAPRLPGLTGDVGGTGREVPRSKRSHRKLTAD